MPFTIVCNDMTTMQVDAVVNPTGRSFPGDAKITIAHGRTGQYVIHTAGPTWHGGGCGEEQCLASCYRTSLQLAKANGCQSVAVPLMAAGASGYPKDQALRVAVDTIREFLLENEMMVYLVVSGRGPETLGGRLFWDIAQYIGEHYVQTHPVAPHKSLDRTNWRTAKTWSRPECMVASCAPMGVCAAKNSLDDILVELDAGFSETLLQLIDRTGKKDSDIYKKANVDRKLFSKIRNNPDYKPSKTTAIAFAIALELDLEETRDLIARAGFALSHSSRFDVIIEYFIRQKIYDVYTINEALFAFDQSLLGA